MECTARDGCAVSTSLPFKRLKDRMTRHRTVQQNRELNCSVPLDEKIDSVNAYIRRFERMASDAEWK